MSGQQLKPFLTSYICSLLERTGIEKNAIRTGFDWVIYNLGMAKSWSPFQLPFFREPSDATSKAKRGEPEFGEDISFLSRSKKEYYIFVLKDEPLTYRNWTRHNFDSDLRRAVNPDLNRRGLESVDSVKVILAYNKDENKNGIQSYEQFIRSQSTKIAGNVKLSFERWNLTRIVEEIESFLITPDLLPQYLAGQFRYICSQVKDFDFSSRKWEEQLLPNWRSFLSVVLQEPVDERKVRLVPVALMILNHYLKDSPNSYPGWIDLMEWAMLGLWACSEKVPKRKSRKLKDIIVRTWLNFYVAELEKYFLIVERTLTTQHGFSVERKGLGLGVSPINDAYLAYWHIGRLGILTLAPQDFQTRKKSEYEKFIQQVVSRSAECLVRCIHVNPAALRPLVDLNHIELFLIWLVLWQAGRRKDLYEWLSELETRLLIRRARKHISVPFIEANSWLDLVAEYAATSERPYNYSDSSSYLLLMILELCFSLPDAQRDELLERYMKRVVKGIGDDGQSLVEGEIELQSWVPPGDWSESVLKEAVTDGIAIITSNFELTVEKAKSLAERIKELVEQTRQKHPWKAPAGGVPLTAYILACIKHRSPLPPEFWRDTIFATVPEKTKKAGGRRKQMGSKSNRVKK